MARFFHRFRYLLKKLSRLGVQPTHNRYESKNIILLNIACLVWIPLSTFFVFHSLSQVYYPEIKVVYYLGCDVMLLGILALQAYRRYKWAKLAFLMLSLIHYFTISVALYPGGLLEFFLILIPIFSLLFFNNSYISFGALAISFLFLIIAMTGFGNYESVDLQPFGYLTLFIAVFAAFHYLKKINLNHEKLLEKERNRAINDGLKIEKQRKELEELNHFQSQFWINLSHELRTPLTLILGNSGRLNPDTPPEKLAYHSQHIRENAVKIQQLVDNIMDLAKIKANKLELQLSEIDVVKLCRKVFYSFEPLFSQKEIQCSFTFIDDHSTPIIQADSFFLERALSNIVVNACHYTPKKGRIELHISCTPTMVHIAIQDNGIGIDPAEVHRIFDPYYRAENAKNQAGGTGIGLPFAKEVVEMHHGSIAVESTPNKGTTFTLNVPTLKTSSSTDNTPGSIPRPTKPDQAQGSILLVEDSDSMREYIVELLHEFEVYEAADGMQALAILEQKSIDLIITDYMMPEMDGYQLVEHLRGKNIDTPVIVITARVDPEGKLNMLRLGIDDYLIKPFQEEELLIRIGHSLNNFSSRKESLDESMDEEESLLSNEELIPIKEIIEKNIADSQFNVQFLAEALCMTERTLHRRLKNASGMSPIQFIREVKLLKAHTLVKSGNTQSIKEIAQAVGFQNSGHFARLYKERFGVKPQFSTTQQTNSLSEPVR